MAGCKSKQLFIYTIVFLFILSNQPIQIFAQNDAPESAGMETEPAAPASTKSEAPAPSQSVSDDVKEGIIDSKDAQEINILRGELATVRVHSLTRLSIADPNIADVATVDADKMMIIGKTIGQTPFFIWDEFGKKTFIVRVYEEDLVYIKNRVKKLIDALGIEGVKVEENVYEGKVMLIGQLPQEKIELLNASLGSIAGKTVNLITKEESEDLVQIDMQIAELNTTLQKSLGFDWGAQSLTYQEAIPTADDQLGRFVKIGEFTRTSALLLTVNNLLEEGKARLLSKPRMLVISGKEARLQVGGQYPIKTTTEGVSGSSTESVTFKDYGIGMTITPTITKGKINIEMSIDISDIDSSVATTGQGSVAFSSRTANTTVLLDDRQTIVIAGLIKNNKSLTYNKVPILGDIPIVGFFFRSKQTPAADKETEVVITLTPTIIPQKYASKDDKSDKDKEAPQAAAEQKKDNVQVAKADVPAPTVNDKAPSSMTTETTTAEAVEHQATGSSLSETTPATEPVVQGAVQEKATIKEDTIQAMKEAEPTVAPSSDTKTSVAANIADADSQIVFEDTAEQANTDNTEEMATYVKSIQKKISEAITYPYEASEKGWSGTVKLTLHILKDGTLDEIAVKESSGHDVFDKDAVNTAQILAPYASFPPDLNLSEIKVIIPIVYSQGSASLDVVCKPKHKMDLASNKSFSFSSGKTYAEMVQERIARSILYPDQAKQSGWEGMVKLNLRILRDGTLANASIKESSGNTMFDECALQTAKTLAPYSVFPTESELQDLSLTVPIIYSLSK